MRISDLRQLEQLAHAYVVSGVLSESLRELKDVLQSRGVTCAGNPDVFEVSTSDFGVEDARSISELAVLKPFGDSKYFLISLSKASREAQNALLKVIEEAPGHSIFFFIVESAGHLLPTIRSRSIDVHGPSIAHTVDTEEADAFLKATFESRLSTVEKMTSYITKTQDRSVARGFVASLLVAAKTAGLPVSSVRDILDADQYLRTQGGSAKAVLSHLAVSLPRKKRSATI